MFLGAEKNHSTPAKFAAKADRVYEFGLLKFPQFWLKPDLS